jgi:hypothetical protein
MTVKYTKAILEQAVSRAYSLAGVLRALGFESYSGGTSSHLRSRIELYGIDTSHFLGLHVGSCHAQIRACVEGYSFPLHGEFAGALPDRSTA